MRSSPGPLPELIPDREPRRRLWRGGNRFWLQSLDDEIENVSDDILRLGNRVAENPGAHAVRDHRHVVDVGLIPEVDGNCVR